MIIKITIILFLIISHLLCYIGVGANASKRFYSETVLPMIILL